jgi:hypothetical protein
MLSLSRTSNAVWLLFILGKGDAMSRYQEDCQMPLTGLLLPNQLGFHTDNPREVRIICALAHAPCTREELDRIAGASNVPDAIAALRRKGLDIPACREPVVDRDQEVVYRGRYRFTDADLQRTRTIWEV